MIRPRIKKLLADFLIDDDKTDIELLALAIGSLKTSDNEIMRHIGNRMDAFVNVSLEEARKVLMAEAEKMKPKLTVVK